MKYKYKHLLTALTRLVISAACLFAATAWASDCAQRLNDYSRASSASLIIQNDRALMVWVPYGSAPGWDFPGGTKKSGEFACETAERETCEETGFAVRATGKLSYNVFHAELTGGQGCSSPVDEGFLEKRWVSYSEVDGLQLRGGTWGDKRGILKQELNPGSSTDACGCAGGQGWSSTYGECRWGSETDANEAQQCQNSGGGNNSGWHASCQPYMIDALGKFSSNSAEVEGMRWNTEPVSWRACAEQYQQGNNGGGNNNTADACGCTGGEGWSSTYGKCRSGSETDANEAQQCQNSGGNNTAWHASCEGYMKDALSNYARNSNEVEGMRWNTDPVSWRSCVEQYQSGGGSSSNNTDVICVFDYDLTLSSHHCSATAGRSEFNCTKVGSTYGWTDQCLATAAREAVQRCTAENAKVAIASHSSYDQAKINALSATGWPADGHILMQPGRNKAEMINDIKSHYSAPNAKVIFWDDTSGNISAVSGMADVFAVEVDRGNPRGSNCGIQSQHISQGWNAIGR